MLRRLVEKFRERGMWGWYTHIREELENQKQNRELVGEDREGNKYYQYYSPYGLPTRREVRFKDPDNFDMKDLVYYRWLYKFDLEPLTTQQKEQLYAHTNSVTSRNVCARCEPLNGTGRTSN